MRKNAAVLFAMLAVFALGCGSSENTTTTTTPAPENSAKVAPSKMDELRRKADLTEAASMVGYDGKAIKESLHKVLDEQENAAKRLEDLNNIR
ncbi:MAG: hypothetical protein PHD82_00545 [Candidatus Riflebacteria bacterium]|nr:hypothetical protein [Candidatus Riflebacteria bacterium]